MPALLLRTGAASLAALAAATTAAAAPALHVTDTSHALGVTAGAVIATQQDPSAYRTTVYAPAAYGLRVSHAGSTIGSAIVRVSTAAGALTFAGWITGAGPAGYVSDDCAAFAGYQHLAVWVMEVRQVDGIARAEIPIFVDPGPGGTTQLTWCASSAADMSVTAVTVRLDRALVNPAAHGAYAWRAHFDLAGGNVSALGLEHSSAVSVVRL
jgi:hypothetical protein